jgi:DNA-binding IclR family transcriptional regulator
MLAEEKDEDSRQGIQSIEVGMPLLRVLADHGAPMMLRDLAKAAGMPAAKAHRYLVSFIRTGLVTQDRVSGRYDLGHFALDLGLASLARLDAVRVATPVLDALAEEIGETVAMAVWGNMGNLMGQAGQATAAGQLGAATTFGNALTTGASAYGQQTNFNNWLAKQNASGGGGQVYNPGYNWMSEG